LTASSSDALTLLELVRQRFPEEWERYCASCAQLFVKPGQSGTIGARLAPLFMPSLEEVGRRARQDQAHLVRRLKSLLPNFAVVGDDANHKKVPLERRHWTDAAIDISASSITHGAQTWTNVEVRPQRSASNPTTSRNLTTAKARSWIDDTATIEKYLKARKSKPDLSVRTFVLKQDRQIKGSNPLSKIRRIQKKLKERG
jgi:hypothetical protein